MLFKFMSLVMLAIAGMFMLNVSSEHAVSAALIPAAAAIGIAILGAN
ncbi:MAG: hypothetical protein ABL907_24770 [Hyphomicrobium sp.]